MENKSLQQCICELIESIADENVLSAIYSFITHYTDSTQD